MFLNVEKLSAETCRKYRIVLKEKSGSANGRNNLSSFIRRAVEKEIQHHKLFLLQVKMALNHAFAKLIDPSKTYQYEADENLKYYEASVIREKTVVLFSFYTLIYSSQEKSIQIIEDASIPQLHSTKKSYPRA